MIWNRHPKRSSKIVICNSSPKQSSGKVFWNIDPNQSMEDKPLFYSKYVWKLCFSFFYMCTERWRTNTSSYGKNLIYTKLIIDISFCSIFFSKYSIKISKHSYSYKDLFTSTILENDIFDLSILDDWFRWLFRMTSLDRARLLICRPEWNILGLNWRRGEMETRSQTLIIWTTPSQLNGSF